MPFYLFPIHRLNLAAKLFQLIILPSISNISLKKSVALLKTNSEKKKKTFRLLFIILILQFLFLQVFAQLPAIVSFTPEKGSIGSTITISGTNFNTTDNQNIVYFGATKANVTTASATSLTVTVPTGATYEYLTVTNLASNLTAYSAKPFIVTFSGEYAFKEMQNISTGSRPIYVLSSDFDLDGKPDLVVINSGSSSNSVSVLQNTSSSGTVSFASKVDFPTGTTPQYASIGDIDGDGKADLAVPNYESGTVSIFRNIYFSSKTNCSCQGCVSQNGNGSAYRITYC